MGRSLQRKIFIIVSLSLLYLTLMAPMLNYLINAFSDNTDIWWYYVDILIVVFIMVYWYTVREINEPKLNEKITSEIKKIKKEYVEHKIKENEQKEKLEKRKMKK